METQEKKEKALVGIVMGSASDAEVMREARRILEVFGVESEVRVLSAHRTPEQTAEWAKNACDAGMKIIIAAAGMAAHLAGVVSAHTSLPVIGVPMSGGVLDGLDALLSTVQMPKGTPVATMGIGKAGAVNAALFAVRILALENSDLHRKLEDYRRARMSEVLAADRAIEKDL